MKFSIIVPIYNRPDEAVELLESLNQQSQKNFELVLIEDGSTLPCSDIVSLYADKIEINYITKSNTGRSDTRNVGMKAACGDYFVFFDSDCIIPPQYFETLEKRLTDDYADCFGGPDAAHESFTKIQKAVNYAMTSFWTTGGIRGGKVKMEKFKPRTFNMGFARKVYETVGGFKDMFGEDIDLAIRINRAGFATKLYSDVFVYHKRRVSLKKFYKQVNIFGQARINLYILYPDSLKLVHALPAIFVGGIAATIAMAVFFPLLMILPAAYILLLFSDSLIKNRSIEIAALSMVTGPVQIFGYGLGFIKAFVQKVILRKGLEDVETLKKVYK
ncbi:MAG: glycosyltransferase [Prevotellaceae bacterium]|jgi:glycosyltransferase involved in cell wall biosynthesis|nr:glycosyltransferase [Prevotellaceae bacterium]